MSTRSAWYSARSSAFCVAVRTTWSTVKQPAAGMPDLLGERARQSTMRCRPPSRSMTSSGRIRSLRSKRWVERTGEPGGDDQRGRWPLIKTSVALRAAVGPARRRPRRRSCRRTRLRSPEHEAD